MKINQFGKLLKKGKKIKIALIKTMFRMENMEGGTKLLKLIVQPLPQHYVT